MMGPTIVRSDAMLTNGVLFVPVAGSSIGADTITVATLKARCCGFNSCLGSERSNAPLQVVSARALSSLEAGRAGWSLG
jgi:hypothetical protein